MKVVVTIIIAIVAFEIIEHIVFPLIALVFTRRRRSLSGAEGLIGQVAEVTRWRGSRGTVSVRGELWKAVSDEPLAPGDRAVVQRVDGMTLRVARNAPDRR